MQHKPTDKDLARLKRLAQKLDPQDYSYKGGFDNRIENEDGDRKELWWSEEHEMFSALANPQMVLWLLSERERLMNCETP